MPSRCSVPILAAALLWGGALAAQNTPPVLNPFVMAPSVVAPLAKASFLLSQNPALNPGYALNLALLYEEEAESEGVSADLAFAQMCLETSFLRFGSQVKSGQNNFAGLGALDGVDTGLAFPSPRIGVRAQVQHLKYYASTLPLKTAPVNPRLNYVTRGIAPTAWQLSKTWASDADYGKKILALLQRMLDYARNGLARPARSALSAVASPPPSGN